MQELTNNDYTDTACIKLYCIFRTEYQDIFHVLIKRHQQLHARRAIDAYYGELLSKANTPYQSPSCENMYSGISLIRSPMGLDRSDLNGGVALLQGAKLHRGIQFGTEQE